MAEPRLYRDWPNAWVYEYVARVWNSSSGLPSRSTQGWVNRPKFQITDSVVTMMINGRRIGRMMLRSVCHGEAPSTVAASINSRGTWVRPAFRVIARNG